MAGTGIYKMSAEERQREYEKEGLPSRKIAEWEAEVRRATKRGDLAALEEQFGAPKDVGTQQDRKEFTLDDMSRREFEAGGDLRSITMSPLADNRFGHTPGIGHTLGEITVGSPRAKLERLHKLRMLGARGDYEGLEDVQGMQYYKDLYSLRDQRAIERLLEARSGAATNPELEEHERQSFFGRIDRELSLIPKISPMMKEPTEQQKVDARIVTVDGVKYYSDGKSLKPVNAEAVKAKTAQDEAIAKRAEHYSDEIMKKQAEDREKQGPNFVPRSNESIFEEGRMMAQQQFGLIKPSGSQIPDLDPVWTMFKSKLDEKLGSQGRATEAQMTDELLPAFVFYADNMGISPADAKYSFLQYWQKAIDNGDPIVARMSPKTQRRMWSVGADTIDPGGVMRSRIAEIDGLRAGEGRVTSDGKTSTVFQGQVTQDGRVTSDGKEAKVFNGLPVLDTPEEADKLPSGTVFYDSNYVLRKKP